MLTVVVVLSIVCALLIARLMAQAIVCDVLVSILRSTGRHYGFDPARIVAIQVADEGPCIGWLARRICKRSPVI